MDGAGYSPRECGVEGGAEMKDMMAVACFGQPGSYSDQAMHAWFADRDIDPFYVDHFEDVMEAVSEGRARYGVVPIENSSTGGITDVYDLIRRYRLAVVGEKCIRIEHHLLGLPGAALSDIRRVYSHPQGFAQCGEFFKEHSDWEQVPYFSTSGSAEKVASGGRRDEAAVAGLPAAKRYGLSVLAPSIQTNRANFTRFFIIAPDIETDARSDKITLVIAVHHRPGALYHVLGYFFYGGMNMTHLESRPMEGHPFDYFFHIDVMGRLDDPSNAQTLRGLASMCSYFRILGNYAADKEGGQ